MTNSKRLEIPEKFRGFLEPYRYKGCYGGRGGAKSWTIADILVNIAARQPELVVCGREFQNSIEDSVYRLLEKRIKHFNLPYIFKKTSIECTQTGSEFIFKGLSKLDGASLKSLEGATKLWLEEAQNISHASYENVIPTIRADNSEIWLSWNSTTEDSPTHQRFIVRPPPNSYIVKVNWSDNPWFPKVLDEERRTMQLYDPKRYMNVWEGEPSTFAEGAYFRDEMELGGSEGRIGQFPYNPNKPVYLFWDMGHAASGKGDPHALLFIQEAGGDLYNAIDCWEGNNISLPAVMKDVVMAKGYTYAKMVMPHDARNTSSHSGKTDVEIVADFFKGSIEVQERTQHLDKDVNNIRLVIPVMRFNEATTKPLVASLKQHRQEKDEKTGLWRFKHDWTSHLVSATRSFSVFHNSGGFRTINTNWRSGGTPSRKNLLTV